MHSSRRSLLQAKQVSAEWEELSARRARRRRRESGTAGQGAGGGSGRAARPARPRAEGPHEYGAARSCDLRPLWWDRRREINLVASVVCRRRRRQQRENHGTYTYTTRSSSSDNNNNTTASRGNMAATIFHGMNMGMQDAEADEAAAQLIVVSGGDEKRSESPDNRTAGWRQRAAAHAAAQSGAAQNGILFAHQYARAAVAANAAHDTSGRGGMGLDRSGLEEAFAGGNMARTAMQDSDAVAEAAKNAAAAMKTEIEMHVQADMQQFVEDETSAMAAAVAACAASNAQSSEAPPGERSALQAPAMSPAKLRAKLLAKRNYMATAASSTAARGDGPTPGSHLAARAQGFAPNRSVINSTAVSDPPPTGENALAEAHARALAATRDLDGKLRAAQRHADEMMRARCASGPQEARPMATSMGASFWCGSCIHAVLSTLRTSGVRRQHLDRRDSDELDAPTTAGGGVGARPRHDDDAEMRPLVSQTSRDARTLRTVTPKRRPLPLPDASATATAAPEEGDTGSNQNDADIVVELDIFVS